jgi:hypothetical protein
MRQVASSITFGIAFIGCLLWGVPWVIIGIACCATVVGIPLGVACFTLAGAPLGALVGHRTQNRPTKSEVRMERISKDLDEVIRKHEIRLDEEDSDLADPLWAYESEFFDNETDPDQFPY